jgi:hypothetical protein
MEKASVKNRTISKPQSLRHSEKQIPRKYLEESPKLSDKETIPPLYTG